MVRKLTLALSLILFLSAQDFVSAQSTPSTAPLFYVETLDITPEKFAALRQLLHADGRLEIVEACVPAHVVSVRTIADYSGNIAGAYADFELLAKNAQVMQVAHLTVFNDQQFLNRCQAARTGN